MSRVVFAILACMALASVAPVFSQTRPVVPIHGIVLDGETGLPISGANIFVSGTTFGGASAVDGAYLFTIPEWMLEIDIVSSMVGYQSVTATVDAAGVNEVNQDFSMIQRVVELGSMTVSSSNTDWKNNLKRFEQRLFSTTAFGKKCVIRNPEVLDFIFDRSSEELEASANEALIIDNRQLGYTVTIHNARLTGTELMLKWEGTVQFKEMAPKNDKESRRWKKNRTHAYMGSPRHFLASMIEGTLEENRFNVWEVDQPGQVFKNYALQRSANDSENWFSYVGRDSTIYVQFYRTLMISYTGETQPTEYDRYMYVHALGTNSRGDQVSWARLDGAPVIIDRSGRQYTKYGMQLFGQWAWERLGEQLPFDYEPDPELVADLSLSRF